MFFSCFVAGIAAEPALKVPLQFQLQVRLRGGKSGEALDLMGGRKKYRVPNGTPTYVQP